MEKYQMTYIQFCENWLENSKYRETYKAKTAMWDAKKIDLKQEWVNILFGRAAEGSIPEVVIRSYVNMFGEDQTRRNFRGTLEKGLIEWEATQIKKIYREPYKENLRECEEVTKAFLA